MLVRKMKIVILLFASSLFVNAQEIVFEPAVGLFNHPTMSGAGFNYPFIPFDYNSDGFTDFTGATFNNQFVYKGAANGDYTEIDIHQGFPHLPLKVMDFDLDGDMDVIMERYINFYATADSFTFFNPDIHFRETIVEAADFNNDGFNDFMTHKVIIFENDELFIHYNQGDNTFMAEKIYDSHDYGDIDVGDIDNDGDLDIVVLLEFETSPAVILFNDNNSYDARELAHNFSSTRTSIQLIDLDGDDDLDIMTAGSFDDLYLLENTDHFLTDVSTEEVSLDEMLFFNVADLDNDGDQDVVAMINDNGLNFNIYTIENMGSFNFATPKLVESFTGSGLIGYPNFNYLHNNISLYDFDGDGQKDIIYTDGFAVPNQVKFLKNSTITSTANLVFEEKELDIFPNPVREEFKVDFKTDKLAFEIWTSTGQKVKEGITQDQMIYTSELKPGMYFLRVNGTKLTKFIKM